MDHLVINGPETVEVEHLLVPVSDGLHLTILLVANNVVDIKEFRNWHKAVDRLSLRMVAVAWHEDSLVAITLDKGVDRVSVGLYGCKDN